MKSDGIKKIINWVRYGTAILTWLADSLLDFPKKSEYFTDEGNDN